MNQKPIISNVTNLAKRVVSIKEYLQTAKELREEYIDHLVSNRVTREDYQIALNDIEKEIKDLNECIQIILN
jgi:predicted  nucleic acid-binding Zn-ribbon protein